MLAASIGVGGCGDDASPPPDAAVDVRSTDTRPHTEPVVDLPQLVDSGPGEGGASSGG